MALFNERTRPLCSDSSNISIACRVIDNLTAEGLDASVLARMKDLWISKLEELQYPFETTNLHASSAGRQIGGKALPAVNKGKSYPDPNDKIKPGASLTVIASGKVPKLKELLVPILQWKEAGNVTAKKSGKKSQNSGITSLNGDNHQKMNKSSKLSFISQLDGLENISCDDYGDDEDDLDLEDDVDIVKNIEKEITEGSTEEPIQIEYDYVDAVSEDIYDSNNVIVGEYEEITRVGNTWKLTLKDGCMSLNSRNFMFRHAYGEGHQ